jgi:CRP-like cAMP-binding protein
MQFTESVAALRRVPMFAALDATTLKRLAFSASYVTLHPGEFLFSEGDASDSVYVVDTGELEVIASATRGAIVIASLGRHQLVGEMGVLRSTPRSATMRAATEVKLLRVDADIFLSLVTTNADAALAVMRDLSDKLAVSTAKLQRLSSVPAAGRGGQDSGGAA